VDGGAGRHGGVKSRVIVSAAAASYRHGHGRCKPHHAPKTATADRAALTSETFDVAAKTEACLPRWNRSRTYAAPRVKSHVTGADIAYFADIADVIDGNAVSGYLARAGRTPRLPGVRFSTKLGPKHTLP